MDKLTTVVNVVSSGGVSSGGTSTAAAMETTDSESLCPSLTWRQRLTGCVVCAGVGMLFSLLSFITVIEGDLVFFSVLFTLGNIAALCGMLFLAGPGAHLQRMFSDSRWMATTAYLVSLLLTLLSALLLHNALLVLLFCLIQSGAMVWYILSYIPFARDAARAIVSNATR